MAETMRAAVFEGNGVLTVKDVPVPRITRPTDVLLRVDAASICGSDLHGLTVPPGVDITPNIIYGHEFCGTVVAIGDEVEEFQPGDFVTVNPRVRCGHCYECTHNRGDLCSETFHYGETGDGCFAEYILVSWQQLYHVPEGISADLAAQTEPLACIMSAVMQVKPTPVDYVLLYGAGPIGLTFLRVLKTFGVKNLIVTAKGERRVQEAKACGADVVVDVEKERVEDVIKANWPHQADLVIDAVGRGNVLTEGIRLLNSKGRMVLFGYDSHAEATVNPSLIVGKELQIIGVLGKEFPAALELLSNKDLQLEQFITHRLDLEDILDGFSLLRKKEGCRVIIYPNRDNRRE